MATTKAFELAQLSALTTVDASGNVTASTNTIANASGDLTLDSVAGDIILDAHGNQVVFKGSSGQVGFIDLATGRMDIKSSTADQQMRFQGNDGGVPINAVVLDMANGGRATFNENIVLAGTITGVTDFNSSGDMSVGGDLTVTGDLTVEGSQVSLNTTALDVEDKNITLNYHASNDTSASADGAGITIQDAVSSGNDASILWNAGSDIFNISHTIDVAGLLTSTVPGNNVLALESTSGAVTVQFTNGSGSLVSSIIGGVGGSASLKFRTNGSNDRLVIGDTGNITFNDSAGDPGMVWDAGEGSDGSLLIGGHTDLRAGSVAGRNDAQLSLESTNYHNATFVANQNTANGYHLIIGKSRGTDVNDVDIVQALDEIGSLTFAAADGTDLRPKVAQISAYVSAGTTPAVNAVSGELRFGTTNQAQDVTNHMVLDKDGKVGIGTDSPGAILDVNDDGVTDNAWNTLAKFRPDLSDAHAEASIHIQSYPSTTVVADRKAGIQSIDDAGNARSLILNKDGGNVGIGTPSPERALHVVGGIHLPNNNIISWDQADGTLRNAIYVDSGDDMIIGDTNFDDIYFSTGQKTKTVVIKQTTGNVGIGTNSPGATLQVGNLVSGETGNVIINSEGGNPVGLKVASRTNRARIQVADNDTAGFIIAEGGIFSLGFADQASDNNVNITNAHNVGIGTQTPAHKLDVVGAIATRQVRHSVRPTLNLDFANSKELDSRITFYRDSIATYYDSKGILRYANVNEPRFDHDPLTGESKGLLLEEDRTNLNSTLYTEGYGNAYYQRFNDGLSPEGVYNAHVIGVAEPASYAGKLFGNYSVNSNPYTFSVYLKKINTPYVWIAEGAGQWDRVLFNLDTNSVSATDGVGGTILNSGIQDVGNGWKRIFITVTQTTWAPWLCIGNSGPGYAAQTTGEEVMWYGAQLEAGSFPTSYVPADTRFTSRSSAATYHDETGILRTAPSNGARYGYKYDGRKWVETGLILEKASTKLVAEVNAVGSGWNFEAGYSGQVFVRNTTQTTAPDGSYTAVKCDVTALGTDMSYADFLYQPGQNWAGTTKTISFFVKGTAGETISAKIDGAGGGGSFVDHTFTGGWDRISATYAYPSGYGVNGVARIGPRGLSGSSVGTARVWYVWGAQLENSYSMSSYIYGGTGTTRSADVASSVAYTRENEVAKINNINYSDWYNTKEGSIYTDFHPIHSSDDVVIGVGDGTSRGFRASWLTGATQMRMGSWSGTAYSALHYYNSIVPTDPHKSALSFSYADNNFLSSLDGSTTSVTSPWAGVETDATTIWIGGETDTNRKYSGHIRKVSIYNEALSTAELQALTENN